MKRLIAITFLLGCTAAVAVEPQPEASDALRQQLNRIEHYHASFQQQVFDMQQELVQEGEGELWLLQPGKFRYAMQTPEPILFVGDGTTLWFYNELLEQVTLFDAKEELQRTPFALLMSDDHDLWQHYRIETTEQGYRIMALDLSSPVQQLQLVFADDVLSEMQVQDLNGQSSLFRFDVNNTDISAFTSELFQFVPPADVDIDDQR
jgi:outer membrane lipoprotein carrier protein